MQRVLLLGIAALSMNACGVISQIGRGSSGDYSISTNRNVYNRGSTGEVTIRNVSDNTLEYNLCQRRLERQVGRDWVTSYEWPTAGGGCTTELRRLNRGEAVNTLFDIPTGVPSGTYRVVFTGLRGEGGGDMSADRAATPSFQVR